VRTGARSRRWPGWLRLLAKADTGVGSATSAAGERWCALYLASWTAVRRAETFRAIYEKPVTAGKPRPLALLAVARRMLVVLNEMMRIR